MTNHRISAQVEPAGLTHLMQALTTAGLKSLTSQPPTLEDLFLRHLGFALITYSTALAGAELYPDMANRVEASTVLNATASMVALFGRIYDPTSIGALSLIK